MGKSDITPSCKRETGDEEATRQVISVNICFPHNTAFYCLYHWGHLIDKEHNESLNIIVSRSTVLSVIMEGWVNIHSFSPCEVIPWCTSSRSHQQNHQTLTSLKTPYISLHFQGLSDSPLSFVCIGTTGQ